MRSTRKKVKRAGYYKRIRTSSKRCRKKLPSNWLPAVLLIVLFTVAAIFHVRSRHAVVHLGYKLSEATKEHERLMTDYRKLQVEIATLKSPRRLREFAAGPLDLEEPKASQIVDLSDMSSGKLAMGNR